MGAKGTKTSEYRRNHKLIIKKFLEYFDKNGFNDFPTIDKIAKMTNLHYNTVATHFKQMDLDDIMPEYKPLARKVMEGLIGGAIAGKSSNAELFFKLAYKWKDQHEHTITEPIEFIIKYEDEKK